MSKRSTKQRPSDKEAASVAPPSPDRVAAYNTLMAHAELVSVSLVSSSAALHLERFDDDDFGAVVAPPLIRGAFIEHTRTLNCGVKFAVTLGPKVEGAERESDAQADGVVDVAAEYLVVYRIAPGVDVDDDTTRLFVSRNAVFGSWPFFRELAHSLVGRMNMPPLTLPLHRLPAMPKAGNY